MTHETIVIGAGVFGLATAWKLAQSGESVLVLERDGIGTQASGFALGRIDPLPRSERSRYTVSDSIEPSVESARSVDELDLLGHRHIIDTCDELQSVSRIDIQLDHQPTLELAFSVDARQQLEADAAGWVRRGFKPEILSREAIERLEPRACAPEYGGVLVEGPVFLDSLRFTQALAVCAEHAGVAIRAGEVVGVRGWSTGVTVETVTGDSYHAGRVLIAAGPWSRQVAGMVEVDLPVFPSKGEILRLSPLSSGPLRVHLHKPGSIVQKKDGQIWVAATATDEGFERAPSARAREVLYANARQALPEIETSNLLMHTVCFRPASRDGVPVIGRLDADGEIWVATGAGGQGIMQCLAVAESLSQQMTGAVPVVSLDPFDPARF